MSTKVISSVRLFVCDTASVQFVTHAQPWATSIHRSHNSHTPPCTAFCSL